jgi:sulfite reductase beta subunit-like hemoprotein
MSCYQIKSKPEILFAEVVQQAQPGNVAGLFTDAGSIEPSPTKDMCVLLDQRHTRFTQQQALRR